MLLVLAAFLKNNPKEILRDLQKIRHQAILPGRGRKPGDAIEEFSDMLKSVSNIFQKPALDPFRYPFEEFGLTPENPEHRGLMLAILADIYFYSASPVGRPKGTVKWTPELLGRLDICVRTIRERFPRISNSEAADLVRKQWPKDFGHVDAKSLRKRISKARPLARKKIVK
jgi:hypothetical protein